MEPLWPQRLLIFCAVFFASLAPSFGQDNQEPLQNYLDRLEEYRQKGDPDELNYALLQIAFLYWNQNQRAEAISCFEQSIAINRETGNNFGVAQALKNIGIIYSENGGYQKAADAFNNALQILRPLNRKHEICNTLLQSGTALYSLGQYPQAIASLKECLQIALELQSPLEITDSYLYLSKAYEATGNGEMALEYHQKYVQGFKQEGEQQLNQLNRQFSSEKERLQRNNQQTELELQQKSKELEILRLREREVAALAKARKSEIALLKKEKELHEARLKEQEMEIKANRFMIISGALGLAVVGLVVVFLTWAYLQKNRVNKTLTRQKREIEKKSIQLRMQNEKITASEQSILEKNSELEIKNTKLLELHREINYLNGIVVNDLKGPLNHIEDLVEIVYENVPKLSQAQKEYVNSIVESTKHLKALILDMEEIEAIRSQNAAPDLEAVDLKEIIAGLVQGPAGQEACLKQVTIEKYWENGPEPVYADREYLQIIFTNLLSNAVKFSEPGGKVHLEINRQNKQVRVVVKDFGPGISDKDQQRLFRKFESLANKPTGGEPSTGLGLVLVKEYTELLNGKVWCESKQGQGASFIVELSAHALQTCNLKASTN